MNKPLSQQLNVKGPEKFKVEKPEPGIYHLDDKTYFAAEAINGSIIKQACKSIGSYKHYIKNPPASTSLKIGSALHMRLLEPEDFNNKYFEISGNTNRATKAGMAIIIEAMRAALSQEQTVLETLKMAELKQLEQALAVQMEQAGLEFLTEKESELVAGMVESAFNHPTASKLLRGGLPELTAIWKDPQTGTLCKAKADYYLPDSKTVVEVKSTKAVDPEEFGREITKYSYHVSAAHYHLGFNQLLGAERYCIIAVANDGTKICEVYEFVDRAFDKGRDLCDLALKRLLDYKEDDSIYTGFSDHGEVIKIDLPPWAYRLTNKRI